MPAAAARVAALALVCACACAAASPRRTAAPHPAGSHPLVAASTLASRLLDTATLGASLEGLVDDIGGRPTGTPALERAVRLELERFRASGYPDVREAPYIAARVFVPSVETAEISNASYESSEQNRRLRVAQMPMTPATGEDGLDAEIVDAGDGSAAAFARAGARVKRHWALVRAPAIRSRAERIAADAAQAPIFATARRRGAVGVLEIAGRLDRVLRRQAARIDGGLAPLPGAVIEREGGERIARLLARGFAVRLRATLLGRTPQNLTAHNIIAQMHGTSHANELVVLAAHLDSWDLGRGALDDGANVVLIDAVAREFERLAHAGTRPRRTIRFVITTGGDIGMLGALGEMRTHRARLDDVRAFVALDDAAGALDGFSAGGRADVARSVRAALAPVRGLGDIAIADTAFAESDALDAFLAGIPTAIAVHRDGETAAIVGGESDTFERVDLTALRRDAAIVGALVWNLANAPVLPPRADRTRVDRLVAAGGLAAQMRALGLRTADLPPERVRARGR